MSSAKKTYDILINAGSGAVQAMPEGELVRRIAASGLSVDDCHIVSGDAMEKTLCAMIGRAGDILIGGGDGTVRSCAAMMKAADRPFGILPLGTMNLLARDLGVPPDLDAALAAYARGATVRRIDVATANDELFLCSACVGTIPELSDFREENREKGMPLLLPAMAARTITGMDRMARRPLRLALDGRRMVIRTATLVVANNLLDQDDRGGIEGLQRGDLACGRLGVYAAYAPRLIDKVRLVLKMGGGGWQRDPGVREWAGRELRVDTGAATERVSLDGETVDLAAPVSFKVEPRGLPVLIPREAAS